MKKNIVLHLFIFCSIIYFSCKKPDLGNDFGNTGCLGCGTDFQNTIEIYDGAFSPDTLYTKKGTTVRWSNTSHEIHAVASDDNVSFNSGNIDLIGTYFYKTLETGVFKYHCILHNNEIGVLIVRQ